MNKAYITDLKSIMVIISVFAISFTINPWAIGNWFSDNLNINISTIPERANTIPKKDRQNLERVSSFIKNEEWKSIKTGSSLDFNPILEKKMTAAGLIIDDKYGIIKEENKGKLRPPHRFLIIGSSSMLEGLGPRIQYDLEQIKDSKIFRHGKYSSGLTRPDYYNWNIQAQKDISKYKPQAIIVQFGGNDGQTIYDSKTKKYYKYAYLGWDEAYARKVNYFMKILSKVEKVYWMEIPMGGNPEFKEKFIRINRIQKNIAKKYDNIVYVECWQTFSPNGYFLPTLTYNGVNGVVKNSDGVHLTIHGSKILSNIVVKRVKKDLL